MGPTIERNPPHLRGFVVQQDYEQYTEVDQAVWRFVLLQMYAQLKQTAHPAYARGLVETGMSVERIPRIREMDECLSRCGWGAVCVDGFIPPRAFQEFQALGVLPIAADIRTAEHLSYTPAPDIIHEAAGHAPIIVDPDYAAFLKQVGVVGAHAFSSPEDRRLYQAIFALSEVKEDPASTPERVSAAERRLQQAAARVNRVTEAARVARFHWWTVEYGLVGTPNDYRLYGAGLLSSLGESHFCQDPSVRKVELSAACVDVDYDITRPQPQLFVARDFTHLMEVLDQVAATLSFRRGGVSALDEAQRSEELATVELDSGLGLSGIVRDVTRGSHGTIVCSLEGPAALAYQSTLLPGFGREALEDGLLLAVAPEVSLSSAVGGREPAPGDALSLELSDSLVVKGTVERPVRNRDGRPLALMLRGASVLRGRTALGDPGHRRALLAAGGRVQTAYAGAVDPSFFPPTELSTKSVPAPRTQSRRQLDLLGLYERALEVWKSRAGASVVGVFEQVHRRLVEEYPDEWLLRWNLLESLLKIGERKLGAEIEEELEALEVHYAHVEPIAAGLRYLNRNVASTPSGSGQEAR